MSKYHSLEAMFVNDWLTKVDEEIEKNISFAIGQVLEHEEYAFVVGKIQGLKQQKELFTHLLNNYFNKEH